MKKSYTSSYLKIYFWQFLSVLLGLASLFIVIPFLSADKSVFGIYSICVSLTIFYSYADIGFISAGQKYASEFFAKGDLKNEIKVISFTSFIFFVFVSLIGLLILGLSFYPNIIISDIKSENEFIIARQLLIILALSSPIIVSQRAVQSIFTVRVKDYIFQRFSAIGNMVKILSVFFFFSKGSYNVVLYFLFIQIVNLAVVLLSAIYVKMKIDYSWTLFFSSFRFNSTIYNHVKGLAYTSLVLTFSWIVYYELDLFVIGNFAGAEAAGVFAIALSLLSLFRSFFGIFYSPFTARFNHFVGNEDLEGLKGFFIHIVKVFLPVIVISILVVSILTKPFILSWVGLQYYDSIGVASLIVLCNILAFISYPAGALFMALERLRILYLNALLIPIIYWCGISLTFNYFGLMAFAIFKVIAFVVSVLVYLYYSLQFTGQSLIQFIKSVILPYIFPILLSVLIALYLKDILPTEHSKLSLLINITTITLIIVFGIGVSIFTSKYFRKYVFSILELILRRNKKSNND